MPRDPHRSRAKIVDFSSFCSNGSYCGRAPSTVAGSYVSQDFAPGNGRANPFASQFLLYFGRCHECSSHRFVHRSARRSGFCLVLHQSGGGPAGNFNLGRAAIPRAVRWPRHLGFRDPQLVQCHFCSDQAWTDNSDAVFGAGQRHGRHGHLATWLRRTASRSIPRVVETTLSLVVPLTCPTRLL